MENIALYKIAEIIAGQSPPSSTYNQVGDGLPFFQGKADFGETYPTVRFWCSSPQKISEINDILISVRAPVGPTNINNTKACIGRGLTAIRCNNDIVSQKYLLHFLKWYEPQLVSKGNGAVFAAITQKDLKEIPVPLPPLATQKHIADILDAADALRRKTQQIVESYDELAQSLFLEMFGDPVRNEKGWEKICLSKTAKHEKNAIVDGPFGASLKYYEYVEEGIPVIRIDNIRNDGFFDGNFKHITEEKYNELIRSKISFEDILIARVGNTIGKSCVFDKKYKALLSTTGVAKVTIDQSKYNLKFVSSLFKQTSFVRYILSLVKGAGQPYLNLTQIKSFEIIDVPFALQNQFAEKIALIEQQKELAKQSLAESENLFNALMQKAFKGELVPEPQPAEQAV